MSILYEFVVNIIYYYDNYHEWYLISIIIMEFIELINIFYLYNDIDYFMNVDVVDVGWYCWLRVDFGYYNNDVYFIVTYVNHVGYVGYVVGYYIDDSTNCYDS